MPRAVFDRETSRREYLQVSLIIPHTRRCPERARRHRTITISTIMTPVLSGESNHYKTQVNKPRTDIFRITSPFSRVHINTQQY